MPSSLTTIPDGCGLRAVGECGGDGSGEEDCVLKAGCLEYMAPGEWTAEGFVVSNKLSLMEEYIDRRMKGYLCVLLNHWITVKLLEIVKYGISNLVKGKAQRPDTATERWP